MKAKLRLLSSDLSVISLYILISKTPSPSLQISQLSSAPRAFMSSKKAIYESSMLCPFGADDKLTDSDLTTVDADVPETVAGFGRGGFGFDFGTAVSLLTRTDAGT